MSRPRATPRRRSATARLAWIACAVAGLLGPARGVHAQVEGDSTHAGSVVPAELLVLTEAQNAVVEARALSAQLDERGALARLLTAERALGRILRVPGVHAWLAEVWLQMGLIAAQRGETGLADTLLSRSLVLDPTRHLGAAEAAPPSVARYDALARARDAAPRSRFRIKGSPATATCWVDGHRRGTAPCEVDLAPGPHLILLEARGYHSHAVLLDALAGTRRPVTIALSPTPEAQRERALLSARPGRAGPRAQAALILRAPSPAAPVPRPFWRRWPVWAATATAASVAAVVVGLATRSPDVTQQRSVRIDPGMKER